MGIWLASHKVAYKLLIRLLGFLLVAEYIPLVNRGQRQLSNRQENEKAVTGYSRGISSEAAGEDDLQAAAGVNIGPAGNIFLPQFPQSLGTNERM